MKVILLALAIIDLVLGEPPVPNNRYLPSISTNYGVPLFRNNVETNGFRSNIISTKQTASQQQYDIPSTQYGLPVENGASINQYDSPSTSYGVPISKYGTPGYIRTIEQIRTDDAQSEPANYNFEYDVQEQQYGNDFGHAEVRQGDNAQGKYSVLLPDGRKQIVEYTADAEGYKPRISYEQTNNGYASGSSGYSNGGYSQNGNNGYHY